MVITAYIVRRFSEIIKKNALQNAAYAPLKMKR